MKSIHVLVLWTRDMAIQIKHRFIDRLLPSENIKDIKYIFIGTFNPASPNVELMNEKEKEEFKEIENDARFKKFSLTRSFYERPPNRFWGIMDRLSNPAFYEMNGKKTQNKNGLKYFTGTNPEETFNRQKAFCDKHGILVTDIVREIRPTNFEGIFKNFPDTVIDRIENIIWNTNNLIQLINQLDSPNIFFTFQLSKTIPNISRQAEILTNRSQREVHHLDSCSGTRQLSYSKLVSTWGTYFHFD